jgi:hypothetical protein
MQTLVLRSHAPRGSIQDMALQREMAVAERVADARWRSSHVESCTQRGLVIVAVSTAHIRKGLLTYSTPEAVLDA